MENFNHFNDCLNYLENLHPKGEAGIELGLNRVLRIKNALKQKEFCPIVFIAGTNGKGSVAAFLEAIFLATGKKTGVYTSPHLKHFSERIKINGHNATENEFCQAFKKVKKIKEQENVFLTYFEFITLAAFEIFKNHQVEILILEMGLGARLDAVNIYEPTVSVLSSVALDHQHFLGDSVEKIGYEKAHVFRAQKPAFCGMENPPQSVLDYAQKLQTDLKIFKKNFGLTVDFFKNSVHFGGENFNLITSMPQIKTPLSNAALAVQVAHFFNVSSDFIKQGIESAQLKGRFEMIQQQPCVVLDMAHNEEALLNFKNNLDLLGEKPAFAVVGMMKDKDMAKALQVFKGVFSAWYCCDLPIERAAKAKDLANIIQNAALQGEVFCCESPQKALQAVLEKAPKNAKIAVFGSFHTISNVVDCP